MGAAFFTETSLTDEEARKASSDPGRRNPQGGTTKGRPADPSDHPLFRANVLPPRIDEPADGV